jgi:hypothetical protein
MEAGEPPSAKLLAGIGPLMGEMTEAGTFEGGEGLLPSSQGVRLTFSGGTRTVTEGPLTGSNELIDRYLIVSVRSIDEAIDWATRFAGGPNDSEVDVRPVCEPWDLGFAPRPEGLNTTRYMILHKSDERSEAGHRRPTAIRLADEMKREGVLVAYETLKPSSQSVRLRFRGNKQTVVDGPFTESKELIAGFSILDLPSIEEAVGWSTRFAALMDDVEIDIRPLYPQE